MTTTSNNTELVKYLLQNIKTAIRSDSVDTSTAFKIISVSMEIIEKIKTNGDNKKILLILTFKELVKNEDNLISNDIINILKPVVDNDLILSGIIDMVCIASKGDIDINKIKKGCFCL
jgi:hypothetical protein